MSLSEVRGNRGTSMQEQLDFVTKFTEQSYGSNIKQALEFELGKKIPFSLS